MENFLRKWLSRLHVPHVLSSEAEEEEPIGLPKQDENISLLAIMQPGRNRHTLHHLAMNHGWEMLYSESWNDGVQLLKECQRGVVLVDRKFLGTDWHALRMLLVTSPASCLIPILPRADDQFFEEIIRLGGYDVLMAPLDPAAVVETVQFAWMYWKKYAALVYGY